MNKDKFTYLAIGDSYTIGEQVAPEKNFPNQLAQLLQQNGYTPVVRIIAKTGWTTDELKDGIEKANAEAPLQPPYDLVTLLIGVNNQYRGRPVAEYAPEFESLLLDAIRYAGNDPGKVVVLSIPDWGVTPFAQDRDRTKIAAEIDAYNAANRQLANEYNVTYIDITPWTREAADHPELVTGDGLHPSAIEYQRWAEKIGERLQFN